MKKIFFTLLITANATLFGFENYTIKALPLIGKTVSLAVTAGMPCIDYLLRYGNQFTEKRSQELPCMPETVKNFVESIVKQHDANLQIACKIGHPWSIGHSPNQTFIYATQEEVNVLQQAIIDNDIETLALHKATIRHEYAHALHKDSQSTFLFSVLTAGASHLIVNAGINLACQQFFPRTSVPASLLLMIVHMLSTVAKQMLWFNYITPLTYPFLSRYQEKKADLFAAQHAENRIEIVAAINFHKKRHECGERIIFESAEEASALSAINKKFAWRYTLVHFLYTISNCFVKQDFVTWIEKYPKFVSLVVLAAMKSNLHPSNYERSQYLEKALLDFDTKKEQKLLRRDN